jgi:hypothetical protein
MDAASVAIGLIRTDAASPIVAADRFSLAPWSGSRGWPLAHCPKHDLLPRLTIKRMRARRRVGETIRETRESFERGRLDTCPRVQVT